MAEKTPIPSTANIPEVSSSRSYWFVRTNSGEYYESFKKNSLIAVGWNYLSLPDIATYKKDAAGKEKIADKIAKNEEGDSRPGYVVNQIIDFVEEMKKGDVVIIPSSQSDLFSFGEITGDFYNAIVKAGDEIRYEKRRKVKWIEKDVSFYKLDPYLYKLKYLQKTITHLDAAQTLEAVDRTIGVVFVKNQRGHYVMRINRPDAVPAFDFCEMLSGLLDLTEEVMREGNDTSFNKRDIESKFNLQSPGTVELISYSVAGIVTFCGIVGGLCGFDFGVSWNDKFKMRMKSNGLLKTISKMRTDGRRRKQIEMLTDRLRTMEIDPNDVQKILETLLKDDDQNLLN